MFDIRLFSLCSRPLKSVWLGRHFEMMLLKSLLVANARVIIVVFSRAKQISRDILMLRQRDDATPHAAVPPSRFSSPPHSSSDAKAVNIWRRCENGYYSLLLALVTRPHTLSYRSGGNWHYYAIERRLGQSSPRRPRIHLRGLLGALRRSWWYYWWLMVIRQRREIRRNTRADFDTPHAISPLPPVTIARIYREVRRASCRLHFSWYSLFSDGCRGMSSILTLLKAVPARAFKIWRRFKFKASIIKIPKLFILFLISPSKLWLK